MKKSKQKHDPVASYARFTNSRQDMDAEQKKQAIEHYRKRVAAPQRASA